MPARYQNQLRWFTVNRLGAKPLDPLLGEIGAMRSAGDVQKMIARFHRMGIGVPFFLGGESDSHNPNDVIAKIFASGLGLPDRDYYVKTDDRFKEARAKYLAPSRPVDRSARRRRRQEWPTRPACVSRACLHASRT